MPARRLPWFKLWPEAMRHEKIVLLSDAAFRTWIVTLAAASEQATRWRFASIKHVVSVTGRPEADVHELIAAKLLDGSPSGEVWVHDWRQWQERYPSDLTPRTLRNGSANILRSLPRELRGEIKESREQKGDTSPPLPPSPQAGRGGGTKTRQKRRQSTQTEPAEVPQLAPLSDADLAVLHRACERLKTEMSEVNWTSLVGALEPMGRAEDGTLHLRAPPGRYAARVQGPLARALVDAGDSSGHVAIVEQ
jgi:hypothetical protein